jgi:hypothetical protein
MLWLRSPDILGCYIVDQEQLFAQRGDTDLTARVKKFAWDLLDTLNRLQARGSTLRIVVPREMEVARELHFDDLTPARS